nr:MAG TPA: hypothetical protein [Caudoviricetes sp.]
MTDGIQPGLAFERSGLYCFSCTKQKPCST